MKQHEELVENLVKGGQEIIDQMTPRKAHLLHMGLGVASEAGELADAVKKYAIYNQELDEENVLEEIGDVLFYVEGILKEIDKTKSDAMQHNIDKLKLRYGNKYSDKAAKERKDKQ